MSEDRDLLRRRLLALGEVNHELQRELDSLRAVRRFGVAEPWIAELTPDAAESADPPFVARAEGSPVYLIDRGHRRVISSGLLSAVLEQELDGRREVTEQELDGWTEGPPVEVLEGPDGPPFIIVAGTRRPIRGLPLPHPVTVDDVERFGAGGELDIGHAKKAGAAPAERPGTTTGATAKGDDEEPVPLAPLPTFLIIGAQKSATRWLRANLGQHPDIYAAPSELEFFNNDTHFEHQGTTWYRAQFGGWAGERIVGEATPGYMMWWHQPEVIARRISTVVPDVRLIAILRNPVDRAYSAMVHHQKRERLPADADLLELVKATPPETDYFGLIAGGWYAASLRPFARRFGDRLLVLLHDDIDTDAAGVYAKALGHVGADPTFVPRNLRKVRFSNQADRPPAEDPLLPAQRAELYEYFRADVDELSQMIGRDLSAWDPTARSGVVGGR